MAEARAGTGAPKWPAEPWDFVWIAAPASGGGHLYIVDGTGRKIAAIWGKAEEKELAARLIAAAPELHKALLAATHALRSYQYGNSATDLAQDIADAADRALALASPEPGDG